MNVSLTPELEKFIRRKVKSGMYYSASEVVREGLRLLREQDEIRKQRRKALQEKIERGIAQLERGEGIDGDEFFEQLRLRGERLRRKRA